MKRLALTPLLFVLIAPFANGQTTDSGKTAASPETGTPPTPVLQEAKPPQVQPIELKSQEPKPQEPKPQEAKPQEAKPIESKPKEASVPPVVVPPQPVPMPAQEAKPVRKRIPNVGSVNLPKIPGQPWRIHDAMRPRPSVVTPGVHDNQPPSDALVLFDGTDLSNWCHRGQEDELYEAEWKIVDGCLEVAPRTGSLYTLDSFGSCQLHIEWMIPEGIQGTSQGRGNSGIKIMERFEVQVLDSYRNRTYADGQAGSIYGQYPPLVNAVRKQGEWQTYEIFFEAPIFENEKLKRPASLTVLHNGVLVQLHRELAGPTGAREPKYTPLQPAAPLMLQDHGDKIRYRNIWIRNVAQ